MKKKILNTLKYIVFLSIGALLLYLAFKGVNISKLIGDIKNANYLWVSFGLICGFLGLIIRAYRWNILIEPLGYKPKLIESYHALIIGYLANFAFPRIGEIVRCGTLSKTEKVPADVLIGTVIAERAFDLLAVFVLAIVTVLININLFGKFFSDEIFMPIYNKLFATINFSLFIWAIIAISGVSIFFLLYAFRSKILKIAFVSKIGQIGKGVISGIKSVFKLKRKKEFLFHTLLLWIVYYLSTYFVFFSIPATSGLSPLAALFILVVGSFGMAVPVQGGFGAYHSAVSLGLMLYLIPREDGLAYAVISHESQAIAIILLGILSFFILFFRKKETSLK